MGFSNEEKQKILNLYSNEMEEIKLRIKAIKNASALLCYDAPTVDFMAIQLRKVIEQIVFASLISNSEIYLQEYKKLGSAWNARYICQDIKRLNSNYFPVAVYDDHKNGIIYNNKEDALSEEELISIYEHLGKLLHSHNPFSQPIDYQKELEFLNVSCGRIIRLLRVHTVHLLGDDDFLFVIMECTNKNNHVSINWFQNVAYQHKNNEV